MSPPDADPPRFRTIDWDEHGGRRLRPRGRTLLLMGGLAALSASFLHDYLAAPPEPYPFSLAGWDLGRMDWLLVLTLLVVVRYAVVPAAATPRRTVDRLRALLARPAGAASVAVLAGLVLTALLGPLLDTGFPMYDHRLQPPVFASVDTEVRTLYGHQCVGEQVAARCHGTWRYPLGTNYIGEDLVQLVVGGLRVALKLGIAAGVVAAVVGTVVGATAGYVGGFVEAVLMRYVEVQQTIPAVVVYVLLVSLFLGQYTGIPHAGLFSLAVVFGLLDWGGIAQLVRGEALRQRSAGYVQAARAAGASDLHVLRQHVIPNTTSTVLTAVTRRIPLLVLAQAALGFLELNRAASNASFGRVLRLGLEGRNVTWHWKWWVTTWCVLALATFVVSVNVFGDALRDVLDPRTEVDADR